MADQMMGQNTQLPLRTPQQMQGIEKLIGQLQGSVNPDFSGIENYARRNFQTKTAPSIAERFASLGGQGTRRSGDIQPYLAGAGADLDAQLANLKSQYGLQQQGLLANLLNQQTQENVYRPEEQGSFLGGLGGSIGQGLGSAVGTFAPSAFGKIGSLLGGLGSGVGGALGTGAALSAGSGFLPLAAILALLGAGYGAYNYLDR